MEDESFRIWLENEDGIEKEYEAIGTFAVDSREYMALRDLESDDPQEVFLLGFYAGENDDIIFRPIDSDEEYADAADAFDSIFNHPENTEEYNLNELKDEEYSDDDYCYQDKEGRLFILDEEGNAVYLDDNGEPVWPN